MKSLDQTAENSIENGTTSSPAFFVASIMAGLFIVTIAVGGANARENIGGVWYDDTGKGAIELSPCGKSFCGRIVWLKQPLSSRTGKPLRDANNPTPGRRNKPICGLQIVANVQAQQDGTWDGGRIYDPKVGKTYDVAIERLSTSRLRITGYLGMKFLGKSFIWRRAPANLARCAADG